MSTITAAPSVPHPIVDRLRGLVCVLTPSRVPVTDPKNLTPGPEYLCPAPTSPLFACHRPLPCSSHAIEDVHMGWLLHGEALLRLPAKPRRRWFRR